MNYKQIPFMGMGLLCTICAMVLIGCSSGSTVESADTGTTTVPITEGKVAIAETIPSLSQDELLEDIRITLPDQITRKSESSTRDYFYVNGEVVGGIALVDMGNSHDSVEQLDRCAELAINVTQEVYPSQYDQIAESGSDGVQFSVSVSSQDGREFYHYFFVGRQSDYDVWMNSQILNLHEMLPVLKTLESTDLMKPQEIIIEKQEAALHPANPRLQDLNVVLPEDISSAIETTSRMILYRGETIIGGIEQIDVENNPYDLNELRITVLYLEQDVLGTEFEPVVQGYVDDSVVFGRIETVSGKQTFISLVVPIDEETYVVWADTGVISEEDLLKLAESCRYEA